ncbi:tail sheath monomer [Synechococcus phage S-B68]|nr:tail sheath monomer [Synechococcus phage S-B68]
MVIKTASPGIVVNEVDLTRGTSDAITTNIGAFAGPFARGPVDELVLISTEAEFQRIFGDPTDDNYEYWYTVANYLEYGGVCYVVRSDDSVGDSSGTFLQTMRNATDTQSGTDLYVKNEEDFEENWFQTASATGKFLARNPGSWGNGLAVAVIDHGADYQLGLKGTGIVAVLDGASIPANTDFGTVADGTTIGEYIKLQAAAGGTTIVAGEKVKAYNGAGVVAAGAGEGFVISVDGDVYQILVTSGTFAVGDTLSDDDGSTETDASTAVYAQVEFKQYSKDADVALTLNAIAVPNTYTLAQGEGFGWTSTPIANQKVSAGGPADLGDTYIWSNNSEAWVLKYTPAEDDLFTDGLNVYQLQAGDDWYTQQVAFAGIPWYRLAGRPGTTQNALERGAANDELNIVIYDATGNFTGTKGNTLETFFGVSKLSGATTQEGDNNYYIDVVQNRSGYLFANATLDAPTAGINTALSAVGTAIADGVKCEYIEVKSYTMAGGVDNYDASLGELQEAYNKFVVENVPNLDYILQGPSMSNLDDSVAKANFIISLCEERKDCMAFLSPPRYAVIGQPSSTTVTEKVIEWAVELSSSSYVVLDSGYKYTYDRYNDRYRNIPLNGDIAGLMVNSALTAEAWYSPAGLSRGQIRNVVKLPYNPSKKQRDQLYTNRVNPVVTFPGEGTILFGDKTALAYSSAFDRINVRKLFLVIEREIAKMSRTTLFEFNDDVTRSLFKNNVNPFLRDIQAKRGMYDFLVVCDTTNNTAEVIDRNEFIADIYIKPTKSVNFISLNFIATKTGVSFDESVALFRGN